MLTHCCTCSKFHPMPASTPLEQVSWNLQNRNGAGRPTGPKQWNQKAQSTCPWLGFCCCCCLFVCLLLLVLLQKLCNNSEGINRVCLPFQSDMVTVTGKVLWVWKCDEAFLLLLVWRSKSSHREKKKKILKMKKHLIILSPPKRHCLPGTGRSRSEMILSGWQDVKIQLLINDGSRYCSLRWKLIWYRYSDWKLG